MDPDAALARCLAALAAFRKAQDEGDADDLLVATGTELADAFEALDGWLSGGGFRPRRWAVA